MLRKDIKLSNKLGLHLRAASKLSQLATAFSSDILISTGAKKNINAKSVLGITMLAAGYETKVSVEVRGPDEELALDAIINLFEDKFGESE